MFGYFLGRKEKKVDEAKLAVAQMFTQLSVAVKAWSEETLSEAKKSKDPKVVKFAQAQVLSLKSKMIDCLENMERGGT